MLKSIFVLAATAAIAAPALAQPPAAGTATGRNRDYSYLLYDSRRIITPYPLHEQILPRWFYREGYRLTPREYHRWRRAGFRQQEVFLIANAARISGLDPSVFANALYRGYTTRMISLEYGISRERLLDVLPEWRTAAWAAATREEAIRRDNLDIFW